MQLDAGASCAATSCEYFLISHLMLPFERRAEYFTTAASVRRHLTRACQLGVNWHKNLAGVKAWWTKAGCRRQLRFLREFFRPLWMPCCCTLRLVVLFFGFFVASVAVCSSIVCIFTFIERLPVKAAQESAASWSADDDAHEDRSEIDDQLNCVCFTLSTGTCLYLFSSYHSIAFFVICATGLHACSQQRRCSRNVHY